MDFISTLWMPILLSAVFVFIASSIIHMFLGYHAGDYKPLPDEDRKMDALRDLNIPPGHYALPKAGSMKEFNSESFQARIKKGPVMFLHVRQPGAGMGKNLVQWFIYCIVVSFFAAYIGSHTLAAGADYLVVHRVIGAAAFMGYGLGIFQDAIWDGRGWRSAWVGAFDALVFAFVTGGTFGWLWPS
jgi:hypothetical protein